MKNKTLKAIISIGITVIASVVLVMTLYCLGPHSENGYRDQATWWAYIPLIQDPYTFNENGPYMSTYKVHVDTENKCVSIGFLIEGKNEICDPDETIVMSFNGIRRKVYRAPFEHFRETKNAIAAYKELVKDGAYVYTYKKDSYGLTLFLLCPMEGIFEDPADLNTMTIGFEDIYDIDGNRITTEEGHSDWIFTADRHGRIVPNDDLFSVDTDELRKVKEGDDARIILNPIVDGVEFCDMDETSWTFQRIKSEFRLDGLDADVSWSKELDENGEEIVIITLNNIRNITTGRHEIYIPKGLAHGWREGMHCSSAAISQQCLIDGKEETDED